MSIDKNDLNTIQRKDEFLNEIISKLENDYNTKEVNGRFIIHNTLLFKIDLMLG